MATAVASLALAAFVASPALAAGSDGPTPYTVAADGLSLPSPDTFPDGGHVNIRYTDATGATKSASVHFESQNGQASGAFIGKRYLPWTSLISSPSYCITWVQVSLYNEHFGEGGQSPVCSTPPTTPTHTVTTGTPKFETLTCAPTSRNWVSLPAVNGGAWSINGSPVGASYEGLPSGTGPFTVTLADASSTDLYDVTPVTDAWTPASPADLVCATKPPTTTPPTTPSTTTPPTAPPTDPPVTTTPPVIPTPPVSTTPPVISSVPTTPTATATPKPPKTGTTVIKGPTSTPTPGATIVPPSSTVLASTGLSNWTPIFIAVAAALLLLGAALVATGMIARRRARR